MKSEYKKDIRKKIKNVLIIGNYGNYNIGDEILLKVTVLNLLDNKNNKNNKNNLKNEDIKIFIPVRDPNFAKIYHTDIPINPFYVYDIKKFLRYIIFTDEVIVGGGGLWHGYSGRLSKLIPVFLISSKILGKRIIVRSVGLYDTASKTEKLMVNLSFLLADECSVRDLESFDNIWHFNKKIKIENDLALQLPDILKKNGIYYQKYDNLLKKTFEYEKISQAKSKGKFIIGLSLKPLNIYKTKEIVEKMSNFINTINSEYLENVSFVFFAFAQENLEVGKENDTILFNSIIDQIKYKDNIIVISHMNPILWFLLIRYMDIFIGMRFHSIIFSFLNDIPFVAIPYANKVWNFIKDKNCPNILPLENFNEDYLIQFFKDNFEKKEKEKNFGLQQ